MKNKAFLCLVIFPGLLLALLYGCKKETITTTATDIDGNVYNTVTIGAQTWMAENLKTTRYRNGEPIPNVTDSTVWAGLATGAYCWYNNDAATNKAAYGTLYNWFAVADGRNIAPEGWHVPTDAEWDILINSLGGDLVAGGKLKEAGAHWYSPNTDATNASGFTALPGGYRNYSFYYMGYDGGWWSSSADGAPNAWTRYLYNFRANAFRFTFFKQHGFSVRCIRD